MGTLENCSIHYVNMLRCIFNEPPSEREQEDERESELNALAIRLKS